MTNQQMTDFVEDLGNDVKLEMIEVPGGTFTMGSSEGENDERPSHQVEVSSFWMGRYAVTREQWREVARMTSLKQQRDLAEDPSRFEDSWRQPVEQVSWKDAVEFCGRLSAKTGKTYRLPAEAEWEYAARAGTTTPFAFGPTINFRIVNYAGDYPYGNAPKNEYRAKTVAVGSLGMANAFGLYDMHGNVWEWCEDAWHENYDGAPTDGSAWWSAGDLSLRALRGGAWNYHGRHCRSAYRNWYAPGGRLDSFGFRVVVCDHNLD